MYYNRSKCPESECKIIKEEDVKINPDTKKPYSNVVCIPQEKVLVDRMHSLLW